MGQCPTKFAIVVFVPRICKN